MSISIEVLKEAISIKEEIELLEARLAKLFADGGVPATQSKPTAKRRGRRKMSAAARTKISAAQKLRWAKSKAS